MRGRHVILMFVVLVLSFPEVRAAKQTPVGKGKVVHAVVKESPCDTYDLPTGESFWGLTENLVQHSSKIITKDRTHNGRFKVYDRDRVSSSLVLAYCIQEH